MFERGTRSLEILELTRLRLLTFVRETEAVFWVFVFPVILAVVLGFAFREGDPEPSRIGILGAAGAEAPAIAGELLEVRSLEDELEAERALRRGRVDAVVVRGATPEVRFDPRRPEGQLARERVLAALEGRTPEREAAIARLEPQTQRGSRYIDFLFAGLLGMNLMGTGIWGTGFAIADMRQKKLMKRLVVTPMRRSSMLTSFLTARFVFLVMEVVVLCAFGVWILDVPIAGSVLDFALLAVMGGITFACLGILLASRARTIEGVSGIMNFALMPMWLVSGVFFSYERYPEFLHPVIRLLPLTALVDALRDVMLDGERLLEQGPELATLGVWGLVSFFAALKIFRWQ
ncbi:MAG: ABC transporter permease [Planctomycetota bacterium]